MNVRFFVFISCFLGFHVQIVDERFLFDCVGNFVLKIEQCKNPHKIYTKLYCFPWQASATTSVNIFADILQTFGCLRCFGLDLELFEKIEKVVVYTHSQKPGFLYFHIETNWEKIANTLS